MIQKEINNMDKFSFNTLEGLITLQDEYEEKLFYF